MNVGINPWGYDKIRWPHVGHNKTAGSGGIILKIWVSPPFGMIKMVATVG
jgi:hypothetical protein